MGSIPAIPAADLEEDRVRRVRSVDVLFLLDATASMTELIAAAKDKILDIAARIQQEQNLELRAGFVAYRDFGPSQLHNICQFTYDIPAFKQQISSLQAGPPNADGPEDVFAAVELGTVMDWRSRVQTVIHIGDYPCHGHQYHDGMRDCYPNGDPQNRCLEDMLYKLRVACRVQLYHFLHLTTYTHKMLRVFKAAAASRGGSQDWITDMQMQDLHPDFMKSVLAAVKTSSLRLGCCA